MPALIYLQEPKLLFGFDQAVEDPRDGLSLFGPLDSGKPYGVRAGVIGTQQGLRRFREWVRGLGSEIANSPPSAAMPPFPGFEAAFGIPWNDSPVIEMQVPEAELDQVVYLDDKHVRVFRTVDVYARRISEAIRKEDLAVDVWFVVIPEDVYRYGRPTSQVDPNNRIVSKDRLSVRYARRLQTQASFLRGRSSQGSTLLLRCPLPQSTQG